MKSGYKCSAKRIAAIGVMLCMLVLTCLTVTSVLNTKAEESIGQGHVNYDVTGLRIRKGPTTNSSIITTVSGGFKFDIYEETTDDDGDTWYGIGFYLNGSYERGYIYGGYITVDKRNDYEPDADFEEYLDSQGFPDSYKEGLRQLHAQYPNWVFVADHNGKDWSDVVENQNVIGRSLIYGSAVSSWKSVADGCYDWESGKYMRDIRRFQIFLSDNSYPISQDTADKYIEILKNADYSISSINTIISCINTFCNFIGRNDIHCVNLKKSKTESTDSDLLTVDEYNQLLKTAINNNDYRLAMLIQVLGNTDIRLNELQYLTTHSLEMGKIAVIRNSEEYNIRIPNDLLDGLYKYIDHEAIINGVIFCTRKGTPLERSNVWRLIKKLAVDAGVNPDKVYPQNLKQQLGKKYYSIKY